MEFIFVCPRHNRPFKTDAFRIIENKGIRAAAGGRKYLDARVCVQKPCPFCGEQHIFAADELACPFPES